MKKSFPVDSFRYSGNPLALILTPSIYNHLRGYGNPKTGPVRTMPEKFEKRNNNP